MKKQDVDLSQGKKDNMENAGRTFEEKKQPCC
jgi:hypothetical protein